MRVSTGSEIRYEKGGKEVRGITSEGHQIVDSR
jgi:hypothetical protein